MLGLCPRLLVYQQIVGQHSALLRYPHKDKISLLANHMGMCRFPSFDDSGYRDVADALWRSAMRSQREQLRQQHPQVAQLLLSPSTAEQGYGDIASLLLQQQSIRVGDRGQKGQTSFLAVAASSSMSCLNIFTNDIRVNINHVNRSGRSALLLAAEEGMEKVVKALLSAKRMNAHETDKDGRNALS